MTHSSYIPEELPGGIEAEVERLAVQAALSRQEELRILQRAGIAEARAVLEVGCGPGLWTRQLLAWAPTATITAIDVRPELLARIDAAPRIRVREQSVFDLEPEAEFDFCVVRLVLQHLHAPGEALSKIFGALRPGGVVVVIDVDAQMMALSEPFARELVGIYAKAERLQVSRGGDRFIGRRLYRLLSAAGFSDVRHEAFVYHSDEHGLAPFAAQMSPARLVPALEAGMITPGEMAAVEEQHRRFFSSPESFVMMLGFAATGTRAV